MGGRGNNEEEDEIVFKDASQDQVYAWTERRSSEDLRKLILRSESFQAEFGEQASNHPANLTIKYSRAELSRRGEL